MSSRREETFRVFIGGLPRQTKLKDIEQFLRRFARRFDVLMKDGYAFIVSTMEKFTHPSTAVLPNLFYMRIPWSL